jgi:hypothetical protein
MQWVRADSNREDFAPLVLWAANPHAHTEGAGSSLSSSQPPSYCRL